ncbi:MAG: hypothetical protein H0U59_04585 [Gemmatimonadaceae bacterium]|nr:hypothetical protein [Gemmatimonadaceae bacterium]
MRRLVAVLGVVTLLLTLLFWVGLVLVLATMNDGTDAAGRGMGYFIALSLTIVVWILPAVLMLIAAKRGEMPPGDRRAALFLVPLSFAGGVAVIYVLSNDVVQPGRIPIVIAAAMPLLMMGYFVWGMFPSLRMGIPATSMSRVTWGLVLGLSLVPWPLLMAKNRRGATAQAKFDAAEKASQNRDAKALEAKLAALTPNTPLREWLLCATEGKDLRERTLEGIRALPRRQVEAEAMRGDDIAMLMSELRNLDLDASPALCRSAGEFLVDHAESFRGKAADTARYEIESQSIERYHFAMQWLATNKCDLMRAIDAYDNVVRLFPTAPDLARFLASLASFRSLAPP